MFPYRSGESSLNSATCGRCGNSILGPIKTVDDIKWFIGDMVFAATGPKGEDPAPEDFFRIWRAAKDSMELLVLSEEIHCVSEKAVDLGCYTEHMRQEMRQLLDSYDKVSEGSRRMVEDRSHLPDFLRQICYPEMDKEGKEVYNKEPELSAGDQSQESFPPVLYGKKNDEFHATETHDNPN